MKVHLVGGFLGSGKTTAIIAASKALAERGEQVGVITNDQGKYLVDTAFVREASLPAVEVTGGCFCCNYGDYREMIRRLDTDVHPSTLFAESVGTCSDIVATVVRPSQIEERGSAASFSVFVDIRLVKIWLQGGRLPFSEDVVYLFTKQMEEAGLIVVNKADLLPREEAETLRKNLAARFRGKATRLQSSLSRPDIEEWLVRICAPEAREALEASGTLDIDYERYGAAEAALSWYDAEVTIGAGSGSTSVLIRELLVQLRTWAERSGRHIGHLKAHAVGVAGSGKLSVTSADSEVAGVLPELGNSAATLLLNARVESSPEELRSTAHLLFEFVCKRSERELSFKKEDAFRPSFPKPTHRIPAVSP